MRYRNNKICPFEGTDERTNAATDGQPENIMHSPTLSSSDGIKRQPHLRMCTYPSKGSNARLPVIYVYTTHHSYTRQ